MLHLLWLLLQVLLLLLWQETKRKELTTQADVHSRTIFNSHVKKWFPNTFVLDSNVKMSKIIFISLSYPIY